MATTAAFFPLSLTTVFDRNGLPIPGARLTFEDAGTTTPRSVYQDAAMDSVFTSPVLTDGFGRIPAIFVGSGAYKVVIQAPDGAQIGVADGLPGAVTTPDDPTPTTPVIPTGTLAPMHRSDALDGWLIANGQTIGNETSGATSRANTDTKALYSVLWNEDATLPVTGSRGASALVDFNAGKAMALPDYRGRGFIGRDAMGGGASGRISTALPSGNDNVGATVGADAVVLTSDQLASHTHSVTVNAAGGHTPSGTMDVQGLHTHTGTTDLTGNHTHQYTQPYTDGTRGYSGGANADVPQQQVQNTTSAGAHQHAVTTNSSGAHNHTITMSAVPDHTHAASADAAGTGAAHLNMQPSMTGTWYIKL